MTRPEAHRYSARSAKPIYDRGLLHTDSFSFKPFKWFKTFKPFFSIRRIGRFELLERFERLEPFRLITFAAIPKVLESISVLPPGALRIWGRRPESHIRRRERGAAPAQPHRAGCRSATMIDRCLESSYASRSDPLSIETS